MSEDGRQKPGEAEANSQESAKKAPNFDVPKNHSFDLYGYLGVDKNASTEDITRAYRKKAKEVHPDLHPPEYKGQATQAFKELNEVHQVLRDPEARQMYDRSYAQQQRQRAAQQNRETPRQEPPRQQAPRSESASQAASGSKREDSQWRERQSRHAREEASRARYQEAVSRAQDFFNQQRRRAYQRSDASWGTGRNARSGAANESARPRTENQRENVSARQSSRTERADFGRERAGFSFEDLLTSSERVIMYDYIESAKSIPILIQNLMNFFRSSEYLKDTANSAQRREMMNELLFNRLPKIDQVHQQREARRHDNRMQFRSMDKILEGAINKISSAMIRDKLKELSGFETEGQRIIFG